MREGKMRIRKATDEDFEYIMQWLKDEHSINGEGFYVNRRVIDVAFREPDFYVYLNKSSRAIAFITGPIKGPDILSVKSDYQKKGIGKMLVDFMIQKAIGKDLCVMKIRCAPITSIPFWKKMSFQIRFVENIDTYFGYRILDRKFDLPEGKPVSVHIEFFRDDPRSRNRTEPLVVATPKAILARDGSVYLEERVIFAEGIHNADYGTAFVSIKVNNKRIFNDRLKYPEAKAIGVQRQESLCFFIDRINTNG